MGETPPVNSPTGISPRSPPPVDTVTPPAPQYPALLSRKEDISKCTEASAKWKRYQENLEKERARLDALIKGAKTYNAQIVGECARIAHHIGAEAQRIVDKVTEPRRGAIVFEASGTGVGSSLNALGKAIPAGNAGSLTEHVTDLEKRVPVTSTRTSQSDAYQRLLSDVHTLRTQDVEIYKETKTVAQTIEHVLENYNKDANYKRAANNPVGRVSPLASLENASSTIIVEVFEPNAVEGVVAATAQHFAKNCPSVGCGLAKGSRMIVISRAMEGDKFSEVHVHFASSAQFVQYLIALMGSDSLQGVFEAYLRNNPQLTLQNYQILQYTPNPSREDGTFSPFKIPPKKVLDTIGWDASYAALPVVRRGVVRLF